MKFNQYYELVQTDMNGRQHGCRITLPGTPAIEWSRNDNQFLMTGNATAVLKGEYYV